MFGVLRIKQILLAFQFQHLTLTYLFFSLNKHLSYYKEMIESMSDLQRYDNIETIETIRTQLHRNICSWLDGFFLHYALL